MSLKRAFKRSCGKRDGGTADANFKKKNQPKKKRAAQKFGKMVAVMPTKAMMSVLGSNVSASTNMTVNPTKKGTEFLFPAFSELFYDPIISSATNLQACTTCATVTISPSPPPTTGTTPPPSPPPTTGTTPPPSPPPTTGTTPPPSPPPTTGTTPPPPPTTDAKPPANSVVTSVKLSTDISTIPAGSAARTAFESSFATDVAKALGNIDKSRVVITSIAAGSIKVDFYIKPDASGQPLAATTITTTFQSAGVSIAGATTTTAITTAVVTQNPAPPPAPPAPPPPAPLAAAPASSGSMVIMSTWATLRMMLATVGGVLMIGNFL